MKSGLAKLPRSLVRNSAFHFHLRVRRRAPNVVAALKFSFSALQGYSDVIDSSPKLGEQLIWNEHNGIML